MTNAILLIISIISPGLLPHCSNPKNQVSLSLISRTIETHHDQTFERKLPIKAVDIV